MGLFEEVLAMMEGRKKPQPNPSQAQPVGYQTPPQPPAQMVDPMQDPRIQQEMMRDPTLEQKIRQYMIEQMRGRQIPQSGTLGTRG